MCQSEVIKLLEKENKWMSIKEVNKNFNYNSAAQNLASLFKQDIVIRKQVRIKGGYCKHYLFKIK